MPLGLDPVIHQPTRLAILTALYRNRQMAFTALRDELGLTAGNLASHAGKLESAGYLKSGHFLAGLAFELRYRITPEGNAAFLAYLDALRTLLATVGSPQAEPPGALERA